MPSVKEIAARFDKRNDSNQHLVQSKSNRLEAMEPSGSTFRTLSDNLNSSGESPTALYPNPLGSVSGSAGLPFHATGTNLEMTPLSQSSQILSGRTKQKPGDVFPAYNDASMTGPVPPCQPARFLHNPKHSLSSLSGPSWPNAPNLAEGHCSASDSSKARTADRPAPANSLANSPATDSGRQEPRHTPLPVTQLFSRSAAPLYLPELDDTLEKLPQFEFTCPKDSDGRPRSFPPMNLLRGRSLKDLIRNDQPTPMWRDWNTIGSTVGVASLNINATIVITILSRS